MMRDVPKSSEPWQVLTIVAALMVFGLFIRVWGLWDYFLTPDEALVLLISSEPTIPRVLDAAMLHPHPPLRYAMLHFMLYIGDSPLFLRSIAILPGVALIPLFFLLGRQTAGTVAGLVMATMATFSHAAVMLSEVLRTYMLGTFFISVGVLSFFEYWQDRRSKYLVLWGIAMTLALLSHYFAMLVVVPVGIVWCFRIVSSQRRHVELFRAILANLPVAGVAAASYVIHLSSRNPNRWWVNIDEERLFAQFPESLSGFVINAMRLFGFLFHRQHSWWLILLAILGIVALWAMKRRDVIAVIILTFALNIVLTFSDMYPFGGSRQSFFLLPFVSILVGATAQLGWDRTQSMLGGVKNASFRRWLSANHGLVSILVLALFLSIFFLASHKIAQRDFLRHRYGRGAGELPVTLHDVSGALKYLKEGMGSGDILLADRQTMLYAQLVAGRAPEAIANSLSSFQFEGLEFYNSNQDYSFNFGRDEILWRSFEDLQRHVEMGDDTTIWVTSLGWQYVQGVMGRAVCGAPMTSAWASGGASVYGFRASLVAEQIERRFGNGDPESGSEDGTAR